MRRWVWRVSVVLGLVICFSALVALTAWNLTRSGAIDEARRSDIQGNLPGALRKALSHLERRPWSRAAAVMSARCLSRLDFADEAEPYYERAGHLSLDDLHIRAYGLVRGNHRNKAIQAYSEILVRWPDDILAMRRLAAVQITQKDDAEALKLADRLINVPRGAAIGYTLRGVIYHNDGNFEGAVEAFLRVLGLDPELRSMPLPRPLFWSHLGNDLIAIGRLDEAARYLTQASAGEPNAELMALLGRAYDLLGATERAEACYLQAAEWNEKSPLPPLYLGKIALRRGRFEEAVTHLLRAQQLSPRDYDTMYTLSLAYRQAGRVDLADRFVRRAEQFRTRPAATANVPANQLPRYAL